MEQGLRSCCLFPEDSPLAGARIAISERSIAKKGNIFAAVLEGPKKGVFTIVRHDTFDITAGAFLSNGALLLPERIFNRAEGVKKPFR